MSKQEITRESFTEAIEKVVAERGEDYVYEKPDGFRFCQYTNPDGKPGCIVGAALAELGYTGENTPILATPKDLSGGEPAQTVFSELGVYDRKLILAASEAQFQQDYSNSWGMALEQYDKTIAQFDKGNL